MRLDTIAAELMLLALDAEEATGDARLYLTISQLSDKVGASTSDTSLALRRTRTPEWIEANGWSFPALGNGRSGSRHGYVLEYSRESITSATGTVDDHAWRLVKDLRSVHAQYALGARVADGRTATAKQIGMALKAVDLAADALEIGLATT